MTPEEYLKSGGEIVISMYWNEEMGEFCILASTQSGLPLFFDVSEVSAFASYTKLNEFFIESWETMGNTYLSTIEDGEIKFTETRPGEQFINDLNSDYEIEFEPEDEEI